MADGPARCRARGAMTIAPAPPRGEGAAHGLTPQGSLDATSTPASAARHGARPRPTGRAPSAARHSLIGRGTLRMGAYP